MTRVKIEFFGRLSDRFGKMLTCDLPSGQETIAQLRTYLAAKFDDDELLQVSIRAVINDEMAAEGAKISTGDQVAFLSPLSGG